MSEFATLPPELHLMIASYLPLASLNSLVQCSNELHSLLNPVLWSLMDPSTTLVWAASERSLSLVTYTLSHGADLSTHDETSYTALHWAAKLGDEAIVTALLDAGAHTHECNQVDITPLQLAVTEGHINCVKLLLDRGASIDGVLDHACFMGDLGMVELLLKREENSDGDGLSSAIPLIHAVKAGREDLVRLLYRWGADLEKRDIGGWGLGAAGFGHYE